MSDDDGLRRSEPLDPPPGPVEARLEQILVDLREDPREPGHALAVRVAHSARWQRTLRAAFRVVGRFAATASGVARVLMGSGRRT